MVNAIITWNTAYLEIALAEHLRAHGPVPPEVLAHLTRALMEHVYQYGTYTSAIAKVLASPGIADIVRFRRDDPRAGLSDLTGVAGRIRSLSPSETAVISLTEARRP